MGFLDSVTSAVNRGTASVQRTGRVAQLKMQLNELTKQRQDLMAQLGASLYDTVKEMPELHEGREPLFENIRLVDEQRTDIETQIAQIEEELAAQRDAAQTFKCAKCGAEVSANDLFCSGCGASIPDQVHAMEAEQAQTAQGPTCSSCGASLNEGDLFCMACGAKQN